MLSVIMLIAGTINMPNLLFFLSDRYNPSNTNLTELSLKASAICTSEALVCMSYMYEGRLGSLPINLRSIRGSSIRRWKCAYIHQSQQLQHFR